MTEYSTFLESYQRNHPRWNDRLQALGDATTTATARDLPTAIIESRLKTPDSVWKKMRRYRIKLDEVHDLFGIRVIVESVEQCYDAVEIIESLWSGCCKNVKDYIALPKSNGYRSIHLWFLLADGLRLEVQLRTTLMHLRCLMGDASHQSYKERLLTDSRCYQPENMVHRPQSNAPYSAKLLDGIIGAGNHDLEWGSYTT